MPRAKDTRKVGRSTAIAALPEELEPFRSWATGEALADFERAPLAAFPEGTRRLLVVSAVMDDVTDAEIGALRHTRLPNGRSLAIRRAAEMAISGLETLKKPGDEPRPAYKGLAPRDLADEFCRCLMHATPRAGLSGRDVAALLCVAGQGLAEGLDPKDWLDLVSRIGVPLARLEAMVFGAGAPPSRFPHGLVEAEVRQALADAALRCALEFLGSLPGVKDPAIAGVGEWSLRLTKGPWMFSLPAADVAAANAGPEYRELLRLTGADPMEPGTIRILEAFCALLLGSAGAIPTTPDVPAPPGAKGEAVPKRTRNPGEKDDKIMLALTKNATLIEESPEKIGAACGLARQTVDDHLRGWLNGSDPVRKRMAQQHRDAREPRGVKARTNKVDTRSTSTKRSSLDGDIQAELRGRGDDD